jgi:uncharacterized Ntn-hydrolase superfamily protein
VGSRYSGPRASIGELVTYSVVARDPATGDLGVAVQSHWFSVGSIVSWARPGVGAVATQSIAEPAYGPRLLDRLATGERPRAALDAELAADERARFRQVAAVDAAGHVAVHTGDSCIPFAGHVEGDGFGAQANMMATEEVWPAMARAFDAAEGSLPRRLMAALDAAETAGGDIRGRQSAAMLVVPATGEAWRRTLDLRVEDDREPLEELRRLLDLREAYDLANEADDLASAGRFEEAGDRGRRALELAPDNPELMFWSGLGLAHQGQVELGVAMVRRAIELHPGWGELLGRLSQEIAPGAEVVREALTLDRSS